MKTYDYKKAKKYIEEHKDEIQMAALGMDEDWFWTAQSVFEDGKFTVNLDDDSLFIGGINGSYWATPTLEVFFKDGTHKKFNCYQGESDGQCPALFGWFITNEVARARKLEKREEIDE